MNTVIYTAAPHVTKQCNAARTAYKHVMYIARNELEFTIILTYENEIVWQNSTYMEELLISYMNFSVEHQIIYDNKVLANFDCTWSRRIIRFYDEDVIKEGFKYMAW